MHNDVVETSIGNLFLRYYNMRWHYVVLHLDYVFLIGL